MPSGVLGSLLAAWGGGGGSDGGGCGGSLWSQDWVVGSGEVPDFKARLESKLPGGAVP